MNITAVPFRFVHGSVEVSFYFYLLEAISQKAGKKGGKKHYLIKWSSTGKLIYFSVEV